MGKKQSWKLILFSFHIKLLASGQGDLTSLIIVQDFHGNHQYQPLRYTAVEVQMQPAEHVGRGNSSLTAYLGLRENIWCFGKSWAECSPSTLHPSQKHGSDSCTTSFTPKRHTEIHKTGPVCPHSQKPKLFLHGNLKTKARVWGLHHKDYARINTASLGKRCSDGWDTSYKFKCVWLVEGGGQAPKICAATFCHFVIPEIGFCSARPGALRLEIFLLCPPELLSFLWP